MRREMFRRKQNQTVQLIGVHPLGAQLESLDPSSQQLSDANVTLVSSSGEMQQGRQPGGSKFHDAKMTPARRSRSLEGNLDNIDVDHVTIRDGDKRKAQYNSHPHGLDVNESNQQRSSARFSLTASHILGRRLHIIATPTSSSSPPPAAATSSSPAVDNIIKTDVEIQVPYQPKQQYGSSDVNPTPLSESKTQRQSEESVPRSSEVMTKEDQQLTLQGEEAVRMKSEETKMPYLSRSVSVAHAQVCIPAASGGKTTTSTCTSAKTHSEGESQFPSKTNYPDPKTDDNAFRVRTDTASSAMFDISYDL